MKVLDRDRHVFAVIEQRIGIGGQFSGIDLVKSPDSQRRLRKKQSDKLVEFNLWQFSRIHDGGKL